MSRYFIARHGETVFNAAGRMQGNSPHTPLTRAGFAQAEAMGAALRSHLGERPALTLWSSPAGRALQTLAVIAEHLGLDWHRARIDARLAEIDVGDWSGLYYADVAAEHGQLIDPATGLFTCRPPGGEGYGDVAERLRSWIEDTAHEGGDRLVVMHGMSSRVLRALLCGLGDEAGCGAPVAGHLPQGHLVEIEAGRERLVAAGTGSGSPGL